MHTLSSILLALLLPGYCVVAVVLFKTIVVLKNKAIFLSQIPHCELEPKIPTHDSTSTKNKRVKTGKLKLTSTQRNQQTHLPDYPQYRISRLKGARQRSKLCFRKMTLHVYLINRKQRLTSRFSKTNNPNPKRMPIADGIDDGFKYGLIIGIPILLIILILPFYAKYRQKNPSK